MSLSVEQRSTVQPDTFFAWTKNNFYRTSYASHYTQLPEPPKNTAIPGYAGFIPYVKSNNLYGRGYSPITREAFANPQLGVNTFKLSSTGFNSALRTHIDPSRSASSHKYGVQTKPPHHPCIDGAAWQSQYRDNFKLPQGQIPPTYRATDKNLQTEKSFTKNSGFQQNHTTYDGTGWVPEAVLHSDMTRTEYRIQYNQNKPFQRDPVEMKLRRLAKKSNTYKHT